MSLNGRRDGFDLKDLATFGASCDFRRRRALGLVSEIADRVRNGPAYAAKAGAPERGVKRFVARSRLQIIPPSDR